MPITPISTSSCMSVHIDPSDLGFLVRQVWADSELHGINLKVWGRIFNKVQSHLVMGEENLKALYGLPDNVTVRRGSTEKTPGLSWTLDEAMAPFFANRFDQKGRVTTKTIHKSKIYAYIRDRNEEEITLLR